MKLPTIKELAGLCKAVKSNIYDEYRAFEDDDCPGIQLTIGWNDETGEWSYQTGDNSYMGSAYHYPLWAVTGVYRNSNCRELARELQSELATQVW
jgi:hypothetical protein